MILDYKGPTLRKWYMTLETFIRYKPPAGLVAKIAADQVILQYDLQLLLSLATIIKTES